MTLFAAFLALGQSALLPANPPFEASLGVSVHADQIRDGGLAKVADLGLGWIRIDLSWDKVEKTKGAFDFGDGDRWVSECERLGLRALFILDYWHHAYDGPAMRSDVAVNGFVRFVREAAARYRDRSVAWEIWNEPNIPQFWKPKPDAREYLRLALAACAAIREVAPNATIVAPSLAGMDMPYLKSILGSGELVRSLDGVSVHPYREGAPESVLPEAEGLRSLLASVSPNRSILLVNSEWGYSTANRAINETRQAEYAARMALTGLAAGFSLNIWYDLRDDGDDEREREHRFGLFDRKWQPRKAATYLQTLVRELKGFRYAKRLVVGGTTDHCLLLEQDGKPKLVAWTTKDRPTQVALPMGAAVVAAQPLNAPRQTKTPRDGRLSVTLDPTPVLYEPTGADPVLDAALRAPAMPAELRARSASDVVGLLEAWDGARSAVSRCDLVEDARARSLFVKARLGAARARLAEKQSEIQKLLDQGAPFRLRVAGRANETEFVQETWVRPAVPFRVRWRTDREGRPFLGLTDLARPEAAGPVRAQIDGRTADLALSADGSEAWSVPVAGSTEPKDATVEVRQGPNAGKGSVKVARFDGALGKDTGYRGTLDVLSGAGGTVTATVRDAPPGLRPDLRALVVEYDLKPGHAYLEVRPPDHDKPLKGRPDRLGFWMHGDGSGHAYRARFYDATGQFFQPDLGRIDWVGWRYVEVPLDQSAAGRWGGANDGIVHYPIGLRAVLLIEPGPNGGKGTVALADILVQGR